jgi:ankyrin repeat protein
MVLLITLLQLAIAAPGPRVATSVPLTLTLTHPAIQALERRDLNALSRHLRASPGLVSARVAGPFRETLLLRAIALSAPASVQLLLSKGSDPNVRDGRGTPALLVAASLARPSQKPGLQSSAEKVFLELIADPRTDVAIQDKAYLGDGRAALHEASRNGNLRLISALVHKHKIPVDVRSKVGETPLHFAARAGQLKAIRLLIRLKADLNASSKFTHSTPLMLAAESGHDDAIRLLLRSGAKRELGDIFGKKPERRYLEFKKTSRDQRRKRI